FFLTNLPSTRSTLFPYTTLFRSHHQVDDQEVGIRLPLFRDLLEDRKRHFAARRLDHMAAIRPKRLGERQSKIVVIVDQEDRGCRDRKSTRLNSSHQIISYAVFCL